MYKSIILFKRYNLKITWYDIYYGIKKNFIVYESISEYAIECLEKGDNSEIIVDLAIENNDKEAIIANVKKLICFDKEVFGKNMNLSELKWRYCSLKEVIDSFKSYEDLFSKINIIYEDFNYPNDMVNCISYLPPTDGYNPKAHSITENNVHLLKNIKVYLNSLMKKINEF